jgi:hypothetical protein
MPLLAQAFVLVGHVIRDDEMPARPKKARGGGDDIARAGDELQDAHEGHEIRATGLGDLLRQVAIVHLGLAQAHVGQSALLHPRGSAGQSGRAAIHRNHAIVERGKQGQKQAIAAAHIHGEMVPRQAGRTGGAGRARPRHLELARFQQRRRRTVCAPSLPAWRRSWECAPAALRPGTSPVPRAAPPARWDCRWPLRARGCACRPAARPAGQHRARAGSCA